MMIASLTNPRIKNVVRLRTHRQRIKDGLTIIEGVREIRMAFEVGVLVKEIYVCGDLPNVLMKFVTSRQIVVYQTTENVFSKISYGHHCQGVLAVCDTPQYVLKDLSCKRSPLFIVIEAVEKPGNLGAILRTCDAAGVDGVIICDGATDIYNPNVIRASLGAIFSVKVVTTNQEDVLTFLRSKKIKVFAALPKARIIYTKADLGGSLAFVVGSEQNGLSPFWQKQADEQLRIPMNGKADSLNVSTSTAILLYEALRQRGLNDTIHK